MKKRIISLSLAFALLLVLVPSLAIPALADDAMPFNIDLKLNSDDGKYTCTLQVTNVEGIISIYRGIQYIYLLNRDKSTATVIDGTLKLHSATFNAGDKVPYSYLNGAEFSNCSFVGENPLIGIIFDETDGNPLDFARDKYEDDEAGLYTLSESAMIEIILEQFDFSSASVWAREGIAAAIAKDFVPDGLYDNYTNIITRAEFCRMAVKWLEYRTGKNIDAILAEKGVSRNPNAFTDTNDQNILAAFALGVTSGIGNNQFNPNGGFTREQAAGMILNVGKVIGMNTSNIPPSGFADMGDVSPWCVDGVNFVKANGIMQGDNNKFNPKGVYTREQSILTFNNIKETTPGVVSLINVTISETLKKGMTAAEFEQAYAIAKNIASKYAGMSRAEQLQGIYKDLRAITEVIIFSDGYTTSDPHYNDVYGFFVLNAASCAGATRAVGLCLNILDIPFEHINENQWKHQWCRVEVNGEYWICDAYGMYVGKEPAPYEHPYFE
ncbi:MAG: S-layer homology domain-containing protein [Oscillospiraceae bacterium]|nr:S-layer homology domain-containing protein [Oscillospiraceae bacterium]